MSKHSEDAYVNLCRQSDRGSHQGMHRLTAVEQGVVNFVSTELSEVSCDLRYLFCWCLHKIETRNVFAVS